MKAQKRELVQPVSITMKPTMARHVLAVAKQRGYRSRSAFICDLVKKELDRSDSGGQQDAGQKSVV